MSPHRGSSDGEGPGDDDRTRIDRWLWAARYFKTRALAADAVDGGKVHVNGERVKRAKSLRVRDMVSIRLGPYEHIVEVLALSERRGPATVAATLYRETEASLAEREKLIEQHRLAAAAGSASGFRPSKRDRRQIDDVRGRDR